MEPIDISLNKEIYLPLRQGDFHPEIPSAFSQLDNVWERVKPWELASLHVMLKCSTSSSGEFLYWQRCWMLISCDGSRGWYRSSWKEWACSLLPQPNVWFYKLNQAFLRSDSSINGVFELSQSSVALFGLIQHTRKLSQIFLTKPKNKNQRTRFSAGLECTFVGSIFCMHDAHELKSI